MIKVLFTIPNFDTAGSGKALLNIANALDKSKFEAHIMCKHRKGAFFKTVESSGIPVRIYDYETLMRPVLKGLLNCWKISRIFKEIKPDIIHSFHYSADYSEAIAARMAGCKWVFTKKNMNWGGSSKRAWRLRSALANKIAVQNTDMLELFYRKSKKTVLIPRGVNTKFFSRVPSGAANPPNKRTIVCVANLVPVKGVEILIEAFNRICDNAPNTDWKVKIVGDDDNEYGNLLKNQYRNLMEQEKLVFTGKVMDVKSELHSSEIFVLPTLSKGEGSPVSLLEAMSMGLIVLGSKIPGIKDQLKPVGEDHLFEPGNTEDLSKKLKKFMEMTKEQTTVVSDKISRYCHSDWDLSIEVERHERFYLKTLNRE